MVRKIWFVLSWDIRVTFPSMLWVKRATQWQLLFSQKTNASTCDACDDDDDGGGDGTNGGGVERHLYDVVGGQKVACRQLQ